MGEITSLVGTFLDRPKFAMAPFRWRDPAFSDTWLQVPLLRCPPKEQKADVCR